MALQTLGLIHLRLRTLLLARELVNKRGKDLKTRIGEPVSPQKSALSTMYRMQQIIFGLCGGS